VKKGLYLFSPPQPSPHPPRATAAPCPCGTRLPWKSAAPRARGRTGTRLPLHRQRQGREHVRVGEEAARRHDVEAHELRPLGEAECVPRLLIDHKLAEPGHHVARRGQGLPVQPL
jgi:hypothetical protein